MIGPRDLLAVGYFIGAVSKIMDSVTYALTQRQHRRAPSRAHLRDDWHSIRIADAHWSMSSIEPADDDEEEEEETEEDDDVDDD